MGDMQAPESNEGESLAFSVTFVPLKVLVLLALNATMWIANIIESNIGKEHASLNEQCELRACAPKEHRCRVQIRLICMSIR